MTIRGADSARERFHRFCASQSGPPERFGTISRPASAPAARSTTVRCKTSSITRPPSIGFGVEFGRYRGVANEIGFDGLWRREDFAIVVEVKTTDAYTINTATLVGYVDRLISEGQITDWDHAMGLYVVARTDAHLTQLANSIIAEKRTHQLRIATVDSVLSLAELVQDKQIATDEAVALSVPRASTSPVLSNSSRALRAGRLRNQGVSRH